MAGWSFLRDGYPVKLSCHFSGTGVACRHIRPIDSFRTSTLSQIRVETFEVTVMRMAYVCYAALGLAVARWIFKRQPVLVTDPVRRFRASGLL